MDCHARFRALAPTIEFHDASPVLLIVILSICGVVALQADGLRLQVQVQVQVPGARCGGTSPTQTAQTRQALLTVGNESMHIR